jgi:hypothetical protein
MELIGSSKRISDASRVRWKSLKTYQNNKRQRNLHFHL